MNQKPSKALFREIALLKNMIAADKLSAMAWRVLDRVRYGQYDDPSLVRHLHDLALLKDQAQAHEKFPTLVRKAMQDDHARARNNPKISELSIVEKFKLMLETLDADSEYIQEYERFVKGVSYAAQANVPDFATAIGAISILVDEVLSR